jgi:putative flippase GtrA
MVSPGPGQRRYSCPRHPQRPRLSAPWPSGRAQYGQPCRPVLLLAVLSGKALWNPGFIPFFPTLFLLALWRFLVGRRPWALSPALFLLGVLLQIHIKILLDLLASSNQGIHVKELPYQFRTRHAGQSKLDSVAAWDYIMLLLDKRFGGIVPIRYVAFTVVGGTGLFVHLLMLLLTFKGFHIGFGLSQSIATFTAMTSNFSLNNILTYRDMRLKGWRWLRGLISFVLVCSVGALANISIAVSLLSDDSYWLLSAVAGIVVGSVWNYSVSSVFTWKRFK